MYQQAYNPKSASTFVIEFDSGIEVICTNDMRMVDLYPLWYRFSNALRGQSFAICGDALRVLNVKEISDVVIRGNEDMRKEYGNDMLMPHRDKALVSWGRYLQVLYEVGLLTAAEGAIIFHTRYSSAPTSQPMRCYDHPYEWSMTLDQCRTKRQYRSMAHLARVGAVSETQDHMRYKENKFVVVCLDCLDVFPRASVCMMHITRERCTCFQIFTVMRK